MIIMNRLLQPRPPLYNPEDYAMSLKKWSRRAEESKQPPSIIALSTPQPGEMSLRQFASVTDLLNKLKMDLKLALARYVSFIYVNIHDREQQQRKANPFCSSTNDVARPFLYHRSCHDLSFTNFQIYRNRR